eukprot:Awhi_evm1s2777
MFTQITKSLILLGAVLGLGSSASPLSSDFGSTAAVQRTENNFDGIPNYLQSQLESGTMDQNQFDEGMAHYHSIALERYHAKLRRGITETRNGLCRYNHDEDTYTEGDGYGCADTWDNLDETDGTNKFSGITQYLFGQLEKGEMSLEEYEDALIHYHSIYNERINSKRRRNVDARERRGSKCYWDVVMCLKGSGYCCKNSWKSLR